MAEFSLLGHQLGIGSCSPGNLGAFSSLQLHVVDHGSLGDLPQGHGVSRSYLRVLARRQDVSHLQIQGSYDVSFFPVRVMQKCYAGRAVGIIFDGGHLCRDVQLVSSEIQDPQKPLATSAPVSAGNPSLVVPAAALFQRNQKRLLRSGAGYLLKGRNGSESRRWCNRFERLYGHIVLPIEN